MVDRINCTHFRAHGRGESASAHLAEGFDLHGADKRDDDVDRGVELLRQHGGHDDERNLDHHDNLTPVDVNVVVLARFVAALDGLGGQHAERERENRQQIGERLAPVALREPCAEQNDIARLRIGENAAAAEVGIGIKKAA